MQRFGKLSSVLVVPFLLFSLAALSLNSREFRVLVASGRSPVAEERQGLKTHAMFFPVAFKRLSDSASATPPPAGTATVTPTVEGNPTPTAFATPAPTVTPLPFATPSPDPSATAALTPSPCPTPTAASTPTPDPAAQYDTRFGVVGFIRPSFDVKPVVDALHVYSYYDYHWGLPVAGNERLQMVGRYYTPWEGLDDFILSNPGLYWLVGNEPNVPNQDALSPSEYAEIYYYWHSRIKGLDPTARILPAGIVNWPDAAGFPGAAVGYLRDFRESYRRLYGNYPQVDIWNAHAFPPFYYVDGKLHSYCNTSEPKRYILEFVDYLRRSGERQPIWLTEFGIDFADDRDPCTATFMVDMVRWLEETGVVERWYWWSVNSTSQLDYGGGALADPEGNITVLGQMYRALATEQRH